MVLVRRPAVILAALAFVGLASTGCAEQSAAAKVGDQTLSESDLMDEVGALVGNETLLESAGLAEDDLRGESDQSFSQQIVSSVLTQRIQFMFVDQLFTDEGMELSSSDLAAGQQQFQSTFGPAASEFSESFQDRATEDFAKAAVVQQQLGDDFQQRFTDLVESTDVQLNSRFGTWDAEAFLAQLFSQNATSPAITPPDGPLPAPGSDSSGSGSGAADQSG
jgi:hypothetical protein